MLELTNLSFQVSDEGREKCILLNVSLSIPDGELVVVTGPNGGGKSTLARLIAGVETPTGGSIVFDGTDITAASVTDRARMGIAFAFQQPVRFKGLRVLDLLRIAAGRRLDISAACEYLAAVGLCAKDYIDREVNASLSGGELKRIEIATVLARKARLTIFDEPEAGIDLWSFQNLIQVFERLRRDIRDSSIMIISHQERILAVADRIIVIQEGEVLRQGPRDEILPTLIGTAAAVRACRQAEQGGAQ
jgi:Fe-S cluster assembly ATP-binding protein